MVVLLVAGLPAVVGGSSKKKKKKKKKKLTTTAAVKTAMRHRLWQQAFTLGRRSR